MDKASEFEINQNRVWHYTSPDGLRGILENHVIWASSAGYTNDPDELLVGVKTLLSLLADGESRMDTAVLAEMSAMVRGITTNNRDGAYLASACWHSDSLTMWDRYASGTKGYAVVLDAAHPLFIRRQGSLTLEMVQASGLLGPNDGTRIEEWAESTPRKPWQWREVVYKAADSESILREGLTALEEAAELGKSARLAVPNVLEFMAHLTDLLDVVKHEDYIDEREKRILCATMPGAEGPFVKQRESLGQSVNYVELGVPLDRRSDLLDGKPEAMDRLPIVGFVAGPNADPDYACNLLRTHGYKEIPVSRSTISIRVASKESR